MGAMASSLSIGSMMLSAYHVRIWLFAMASNLLNPVESSSRFFTPLRLSPATEKSVSPTLMHYEAYREVGSLIGMNEKQIKALIANHIHHERWKRAAWLIVDHGIRKGCNQKAIHDELMAVDLPIDPDKEIRRSLLYVRNADRQRIDRQRERHRLRLEGYRIAREAAEIAKDAARKFPPCLIPVCGESDDLDARVTFWDLDEHLPEAEPDFGDYNDRHKFNLGSGGRMIARMIPIEHDA